jgi:Hypoxia induced protein conserved region
MHQIGNALVAVAVFAVFAVLVAGLINMLRGGSPNLSQRLMRWRVGLQFLAILIIIGVLFFRK